MPAGLVRFLGLFLTATGWVTHVQPLLQQGPAPTDFTGVLFLLGGLLLVVNGGLMLRRAFAPEHALLV